MEHIGQARRRLFAAAWSLSALALLAPVPCAADVVYTLVHTPEAWSVGVTVTGAASRDGPLRFTLDGFGGWQELDRPYVELVSASPEPRHADPAAGTFEIAVPRTGGEVRLSYRIPLLDMHGDEQRAHGLLPAGGDGYAFGWSWNVLVQVADDDGPLVGARTLAIAAPEDTPIVTGWGGRSEKAQVAFLKREMGNAPIAFGEPAFTTRNEREGFAVEVHQFGEGSEIADVVAEVLLTGAPPLGRLFGRPARNPYRAFVTDHHGGGMGSHFGLRVAHTKDEPPERRDSPWFAAFVLHEHIHDWLGIEVSDEGEALVWFKEGFTEYLSLWAAAATGLVPHEYFATRLLELEEIARTRSALGDVRFGDPDVSWRDGDGPVETLAYAGAPLLALLCDVELRERSDGDDGLPALVAQLVRGGPRTIGRRDLKEAFAEAGLRTLWKKSVEGTHLPAGVDLLERAGFRLVDEPVDLTYLGLRTDVDALGATVLAVDKDGPAAAAGVKKGDVITGFYPLRSPPADAEAYDTRYRFGLGSFVSGEPGAFLGVRRGETDLKLELEPLVLPGAGRVQRWSGEGEAADAFLSLDG